MWNLQTKTFKDIYIFIYVAVQYLFILKLLKFQVEMSKITSSVNEIFVYISKLQTKVTDELPADDTEGGVD